MQELLDEFDPLVIGSPRRPPASSSTSALFARNPCRTAAANRSSLPPSSAAKTEPATKPATDDPLDALGPRASPSPERLQRKTDDALRAALQRSQSRQQALAHHLASEPFRPSNSAQFPLLPPSPAPLITLADLGSRPLKGPQPSSAPNPGATIKIPTELFQHHQNRSSPPMGPKSASQQASPLSQTEKEKLTAALSEDFDDFVSSPSPPPPFLPPVPVEREFELMRKPASGRSTPFDGPEGRPAPIKLVGLAEQSLAVMDDELAEGIRLHLPPRLKIPARWELLYSIDQHGTSLGTLYQRVSAGPRPGGCVVLVIRDARGDRFGAFVNEPLRPSKEYYGTGECFLWKAVRFEPGDFRIGVSVRTYSWTGVNDYMVLSDHEMLSVGGGDGKFGLWIDANLEKGVSSRCPAFGNEILCSKVQKSSTGREEGSFEVLGLECWRIVV